MFCTNCGMDVDPSQKFCNNCGVMLDQNGGALEQDPGMMDSTPVPKMQAGGYVNQAQGQPQMQPQMPPQMPPQMNGGYYPQGPVGQPPKKKKIWPVFVALIAVMVILIIAVAVMGSKVFGTLAERGGYDSFGDLLTDDGTDNKDDKEEQEEEEEEDKDKDTDKDKEDDEDEDKDKDKEKEDDEDKDKDKEDDKDDNEDLVFSSDVPPIVRAYNEIYKEGEDYLSGEYAFAYVSAMDDFVYAMDGYEECVDTTELRPGKNMSDLCDFIDSEVLEEGSKINRELLYDLVNIIIIDPKFVEDDESLELYMTWCLTMANEFSDVADIKVQGLSMSDIGESEEYWFEVVVGDDYQDWILNLDDMTMSIDFDTDYEITQSGGMMNEETLAVWLTVVDLYYEIN